MHGSSHCWKGKRQLLLRPPFSSQLCCWKLRANLLKIVGRGLFKFIPEFVIRTKSQDLTSCGHSITMAIFT